MNQLPEDRNLVNFIQQHQPQVSSASPDLEQRILDQVKSLSAPIPRTDLRLVWIPSVIAASLVASILSYHNFVPKKPSQAEMAQLETFIVSNGKASITSEHLDSYVWHFTDADSE